MRDNEGRVGRRDEGLVSHGGRISELIVYISLGTSCLRNYSDLR